jgi:competence protein ComEC
MDYKRLRLSLRFVSGFCGAVTYSLFSCDVQAALPTFTSPQPGHMRAHFINVGQGSSVLLEFSCAAALIDTGGETNDNFDSVQALQSYLDAFFARRTDLKKTLSLVLITHAHIDHTRGLPMVLSNYTVNTYVDNGAETGSGGRQQKAAHTKAKDSSSHMSWQPITESQVTEKGGLPISLSVPIPCENNNIQFHAMWGGLQAGGGWTSTVLNDQNNSSVVTQLKFGETTFLFMGDLEEDVHDAMIELICPKKPAACPILKADVYHVAHHGSYNGTSTDIVAAVTPQLAVMSMGPPNRAGMWTAVAYGHPRKVAVDMLEPAVTGTRPTISVQLATKAGPKGQLATGEFVPESISKAIYATGWDGTVVISADTAHHLLPIDRAGLPNAQ